MNNNEINPSVPSPAKMRSVRKNGLRPAQKRRKYLLWIIVAAIAAVLILAMRPKPISVEVGEVARGGLTVSVLEEGKTRIRNRYVISPPLAGLLQRTPLRAGDRLEAGKTVVAQLETQPAGFLRSPIPRAGRGRSQGGGGGCPFAHS